MKANNINELCDIAEYSPEEFNDAADAYKTEAINNMCKGDAQCVWRATSQMHKLDKEASKYIDPQARLNFVISRFWRFINENY